MNIGKGLKRSKMRWNCTTKNCWIKRTQETIQIQRGGGDNEPTVTQEQLEAQANLRGSVGGVQGILGIQQSVAQGITSVESAIATMIEIYGFNRETAIKILGSGTQPTNPEIK